MCFLGKVSLGQDFSPILTYGAFTKLYEVKENTNVCICVYDADKSQHMMRKVNMPAQEHNMSVQKRNNSAQNHKCSF